MFILQKVEEVEKKERTEDNGGKDGKVKIRLDMSRRWNVQMDSASPLRVQMGWYHIGRKTCFFSHLGSFGRLLREALEYVGAILFKSNTTILK